MEYLYIFVGVLVGVVAALKLIAPRTKNTVDDKVLKAGEAVLEVVGPKKPDPSLRT